METSSMRAILELLANSRIWYFAIILDIIETVDTPSTLQYWILCSFVYFL
jgi:hypothetical protein